MPSSPLLPRDPNDLLHHDSNDGAIGRATDSALIARLRDSDPSVIDTLVRIYGAVLIQHASRRVGSIDAAYEVVQDVFQRLWSDRATLNITQDIAAYLFWRTRNHALHIAQSARATAQREARWAQEMSVAASADYNTGEIAIESAEMRDRIFSALESVPPRCREIFMLVWDDQLSYLEVAKILGISVLTVRNQMSRAVKHLAQILPPPQKY